LVYNDVPSINIFFLSRSQYFWQSGFEGEPFVEVTFDEVPCDTGDLLITASTATPVLFIACA
jgi:hypothetical protein